MPYTTYRGTPVRSASPRSQVLLLLDPSLHAALRQATAETPRSAPAVFRDCFTVALADLERLDDPDEAPNPWHVFQTECPLPWYREFGKVQISVALPSDLVTRAAALHEHLFPKVGRPDVHRYLLAYGLARELGRGSF